MKTTSINKNLLLIWVLLKQHRLLCLIIIMGVLISGCATLLTPEMVQGKHAEWQSIVDRFERTGGFSSSQLPDFYDTSRLRLGSMVKIEFAYGNSRQFETKTLQDIKYTKNGKRYIVNEVINGNHIFTREGDSSAFSKVICSDGIDYTNFVKTGPNNILDWLHNGGLLYPINMWGVSERTAQIFKNKKIETKILDFKLVSNEKLTIANRNVSCRVYQVQTIAKQTLPSIHDSIIDGSVKIWISDDVPFGFVRSESNMVRYDASYFFRDPRDYRKKPGETIFAGKQQYSAGTSEIVDFKY